MNCSRRRFVHEIPKQWPASYDRREVLLRARISGEFLAVAEKISSRKNAIFQSDAWMVVQTVGYLSRLLRDINDTP